MNWILNFLSIVVFFINRFWFRKKQTISFNPRFWIKDNWPEFVMIVILNLIFMLLIGTDEATSALENLPSWVSWIYFFGKPGISIVLGLGLSWGAYTLIQKKIKEFKGK